MLFGPLYPCCLSCLPLNSVSGDTVSFLLVVQSHGRFFGLNGHELLVLIISVGLELVDVDNNWVWLKMGHCNQQSCILGQSVLNSIGSKPSMLKLPHMFFLSLRVP
jgi:hypothetical protein